MWCLQSSSVCLPPIQGTHIRAIGCAQHDGAFGCTNSSAHHSDNDVSTNSSAHHPDNDISTDACAHHPPHDDGTNSCIAAGVVVLVNHVSYQLHPCVCSWHDVHQRLRSRSSARVRRNDTPHFGVRSMPVAGTNIAADIVKSSCHTDPHITEPHNVDS